MEDYKTEILEKICYTDLVYERINKKLNIQLSKDEIEKMIYETTCLQKNINTDEQSTWEFHRVRKWLKKIMFNRQLIRNFENLYR